MLKLLPKKTLWQAPKIAKFITDFKAKVALEAVRGRIKINQIAKQFEVHTNQISNWKKQFFESLPQIFDNSKNPPRSLDEELTNQLYQQIGQRICLLTGDYGLVFAVCHRN